MANKNETALNSPELWRDFLPEKTESSHKYKHGHALIFGAPELTGATRLAASACARMGAGLVTVLCDKKTAPIYKTSLPAHIIIRDDLKWENDNVSAKLFGSGGLAVKPDYESKVPTILDAEALIDLPARLAPHYILTPHEGEFERAFPSLSGSREEKAVRAAKTLNAHIVLKGPKTIIIAPDGQHIINHHASPYLATAGTGDVLAGMITGLVAQKMSYFEACCAAVWIHGECANQIGAGLVASDLIDEIPAVLKQFN